MRLLKLAFIFLAVATAAGAVVYYKFPGQFNNLVSQLPPQVQQLSINVPMLKQKSADQSSSLESPDSQASDSSTINSNDVKTKVIEEVGTLTQRGKETAEQAQQVLGKAITVDESSGEQLHERALEYGKYLYCQQVVKEWEKNHPEK